VAVEKGSFLKDLDLFDHIEFGISSRNARAMAPATRKLLEQSFLALLDSGIDHRKQPIGCYMMGTSIELLNVSNAVGATPDSLYFSNILPQDDNLSAPNPVLTWGEYNSEYSRS
jgi:hypothetical protein